MPEFLCDNQVFCWDLVQLWARGYNCPAPLVVDIYQEMMITLLKNRQCLELNIQRGALRPYLKTIMKAKVHGAYRRNLERPALRPVDDEDNPIVNTSTLHFFPDIAQPDDSSLDRVWFLCVLRWAFRMAVAAVDPVVRRAFQLHVLENRRIEEAAILLRIQMPRNITVYKIRFLEALKTAFLATLEQTKEFDNSHKAELRKAALFEEMAGEMVRRRELFGDSQLASAPPPTMVAQLDFISYALKKVRQPEAEGAYLCHVVWADEPEFDSQATHTSKLKKINPDKMEEFDKHEVVSDFGVAEYQWIRVEGAIRIGRKDQNELVLPSNCVSGLHATLTPTENGWLLRDEDSKNGTFINGKQIRGGEPIKEGDIIHVTSQYQFIFFIKS